MVGSIQLLLLPRSSFLLGACFLLLGLHHTVSGFQSSSGNNNYHRQQISLQARKHILYTQQQHAYQRISNNNGTTALLSSSDVSSPSDDDELSQQKKFQEHITNMLNVDSHQKVLAAYDELLTMSKMYKKSKQKPPRHWNTRSERIIKLRGVFEIDNEMTTSSDVVGTGGELRWKGSLVQPSFDSYQAVANALLYTKVEVIDVDATDTSATANTTLRPDQEQQRERQQRKCFFKIVGAKVTTYVVQL